MVREGTPDQLGLPGFLWTREAVAELLGQRYDRWLARTTVGGYLRGWGFSPQKPRCQTPVIKGTGKRFRVNMISAIQRRDAAVPAVCRVFSSRVFIDFLGRLLRDCGGRKVHLIVDGHPVHRARLVSAWVGRHADQIELHFLPG